MMGPNWKWRK